jgi:DNA processing protein
MYNKEELVLLWFDYNGYSFAKLEKVLKEFDEILELTDKTLVKKATFDSSVKDIKDNLLNADFDKFEETVTNEHDKHAVKAITYISREYPIKLKTIDEPPLVLYTKGDASLLNKKTISIVGTRTPSDYGKIVCEKFTKELSTAGLVTVSGLAYGIDTIVAETTLEAGGKTIAVMAGGLDSIYPASNTNLAKRVENQGLLVSEYRIGVKPQTYSFVNRNRIVSALGLGTLIIEAGKKSGTMTTAKFAIDQSRELFVVPGNIYSKLSEGTNNLINEMPDTFTISPDRILYRLGIEKKQAVQQTFLEETKGEDNIILKALDSGELSFDELCDKTGLKPAEISSELIRLEMFGLIRKGNGNIYYKM